MEEKNNYYFPFLTMKKVLILLAEWFSIIRQFFTWISELCDFRKAAYLLWASVYKQLVLQWFYLCDYSELKNLSDYRMKFTTLVNYSNAQAENNWHCNVYKRSLNMYSPLISD